MPEPKQKPGKSKQDYATPWSLIGAVQARWGKLDIDLAATAENAKAGRFITPDTDSLKVPWGAYADAHKLRLAWLNPPFANIAPWAQKALNSATPSGLRVIMLTPASVGSNWFRDYVHGRAQVFALNGRLTFEGAPDPYPKDCMLSLFGFGSPGFYVWSWSGTMIDMPSIAGDKLPCCCPCDNARACYGRRYNIDAHIDACDIDDERCECACHDEEDDDDEE